MMMMDLRTSVGNVAMDNKVGVEITTASSNFPGALIGVGGVVKKLSTNEKFEKFNDGDLSSALTANTTLLASATVHDVSAPQMIGGGKTPNKDRTV